MFDFLFELLLTCLGVFVEFLFELAVAALLDLAQRGIAKSYETFRFENRVLAFAGYVLLGASTGG
jgi:hypothetical protein